MEYVFGLETKATGKYVFVREFSRNNSLLTSDFWLVDRRPMSDCLILSAPLKTVCTDGYENENFVLNCKALRL